MRVTVHLASYLRAFAEGAARVEVSCAGGSVGEVLGALRERLPGVGARVLDERGRVRQHVNVFVGAENIRALQGLETRVREGEEVFILPSVTGG